MVPSSAQDDAPSDQPKRLNPDSTELLRHVLDHTEGGLASYEILPASIKTIAYTDGLADALGFTRAEYDAAIGDNAINGIFANDRPLVEASVKSALANGHDINCSYRAVGKDGRIVWIQLSAFRNGTSAAGNPIFDALVIAPSSQFLLYQGILDETDTSICVVDAETRELYYANKAAFAQHGVEPQPYNGRACFDVLCNRNERCPWCRGDQSLAIGKPLIANFEPTGKIIRTTSRSTSWMGRMAIIIFGSDITEETIQRQALETEKERYRLVIDSNDVALFDYDFTTGELYSSTGFADYELSRQPIDRIMANDADPEVIHPDDRSALKRFFESAADKGEFDQVTLRTKLIDGTYRWVKLSGYVVHDASGAVTRAIGTLENIDDQQRENLSRMNRYATEYARSLTGTEDLRGRVILNLTDDTVVDYYVRSSAFELPFERQSIDHFITALVNRFGEPDERHYLQEWLTLDKLRIACSKGTDSIHHLRRRDETTGSNLWLRAVIHFAKNPYTGDDMAFVNLVDDTRSVIQQTINQRIVDGYYEFVAVVDIASNCIDYALVRDGIVGAPTTGANYNESMRHAYADLTSPSVLESIERENAIDVVARKMQKTGEYNCAIDITVKGKRQHKLVQYLWFDSAHTKVLLTRTDITATYHKEMKRQKKLAEALASAEQANAAKSDFMSRMSHDLRTPLNTIINVAALAQDDRDDDAQLSTDLSQIGTAGEFMLGLINDVLDMARIESGKVEMHPSVYTFEAFESYMDGIIAPLCRDKDLEFTWHRSGAAANLWVDKLRMNQIFFNLLSNAIKYTDSGGHIAFRLEHTKIVDNIQESDYLITDDGCGMSPAFLKRLGRPFERENEQASVGGTGLGLAITRNLVDLMGGTMKVESKEGVGTTVTVHLELPLATDEQIAAENAAHAHDHHASASANGRNIRLLVAEDHPVNREIICRLLEREGYQADCVEDGKAAVERVAEDPSRYAALLMDVRMPVMDGIAATRIIRKLDNEEARNIPIIAMTANAFDSDADNCLSAGMNAHLAKPIEPKRLYEMLSMYVSSQE